MILTCPQCATRYFVGDDQVGPSGRTVKCSSCGERWKASDEPALELVSSPEEGATARVPSASGPQSEAEVPPTALPGEKLPGVFRARARTEKQIRAAAATGVVWGGMAVVLVALLGFAYFFPAKVVRVWPQTASAFAAIGRPVNLVGIEIDDLNQQAALQDGHAAVAVSGVLRNVTDKPVVSPPLKFVLLNKAGKAVKIDIVVPQNPHIPPGETRHFAVALLDPPKTADRVQVTFARDDKDARPAHAAAVAQSVAPKTLGLRGSAGSEIPPPAAPPTVPDAAEVPAAPAATDARPLPPSSPYALPQSPSHP